MNFEIFINALTAYFVIVDPIGAALIFHGLTATYEKKHAIHMAMRKTAISLDIVFLFVFYGEFILLKLSSSIQVKPFQSHRYNPPILPPFQRGFAICFFFWQFLENIMG